MTNSTLTYTPDFLTSHPYKSGPDTDRQHSSPDEDKATHTISILKQLKAFADSTSCHGVKRIADDRRTSNNNNNNKNNNKKNNWSRWKNITWLVVTLASFAMACQSLIQIFQDFNGNPVSTLMKKVYEERLDFPSVTFCNLNIVNGLHDDEIWKDLDPAGRSKFESESAFRLYYIASIFRTFPTEKKKRYGHTLDEMLISCKFSDVACSADDFYWFYDNRHGNCFSFNFGLSANGTEREIRHMKRVGRGRGLQLVLDIQSERYLRYTEETGIRLMIHRPRILPDLGELGLTVSPGFLSSFGVVKEETIMAEPPYGVCQSQDSRGNRRQNMYASIGFTYTEQTCFKSCMQAAVMKQCGCCDITIPCNPDEFGELFGVSLPNDGKEINDCNTTELMYCIVWAYYYEDINQLCQNQCPPECDMVSYQLEHSFSSWPNKMQASEFFQKINGSERLGNNSNSDSSNSSPPSSSVDQMQSKVRENLLKLDIYFVSRYKTVINTEPTYTWSLLLSNLGGQLGLWLGFSLLTAFEVVELLFDVVVLGLKTTCRCLVTRRV